MEKTINNNRTILSSELLSENTFLVVSKTEDKSPMVSVCYMKGDTLKEDEIAEVDEKTLVEHNDRMVAVFKKIRMTAPKHQ